MAKKMKLLCPYCEQRIGNSGALFAHCRTHDFLYECQLAGRTFFERKDKLTLAVAAAGGMSYLRQFDDPHNAYQYAQMTIKEPSEDELPLLRAALYAYIRDEF